MTRTLLLAALALACVASPAFALGVMPGQAAPASGFSILMPAAIPLIVIGALLIPTKRATDAALFAMSIGLLVLTASGALAAELGTIGDKAVILPWGDWLVALAVSLREPILTILVPIIAAYLIQAIRKVYPWAALFLSQRGLR
ncbi:hypothetical protein [Methylorubrum sp. SL192]|uniref:hypothetical protein n=1 Tax=Methylorubrum sp. SL192 TaxID=2995167 RepID=UPI002275B68B|nr:hypothetical protein [Methylorubrum sp. SL192]MCY1643247.1 hypothetical protein [Methylorubrum sp. SL192]